MNHTEQRPLKLKRYRNAFPEELLKCDVRDLHQILKGPSLLHIDGQSGPPLFVCTLLHGNEHTGFLAMQRLLREFLSARKTLPRSLCLLIGNTEAAEKNLRVLSHQTDYNRIWSEKPCAEQQIASEVLELIRELHPFAAVDLHNNTGLNPHYACVADIESLNLNLARLFSRHVMIFRKPDSTFGVAVAKECPTVTIEAGLSGDEFGVEKVTEYIRTLLHLSKIPKQKPLSHELDLYENICCVKLKDPQETAMAKLDQQGNFHFESFVQKPAHLTKLWLRADIDRLNFTEIAHPTLIGITPPGCTFPFLTSCISDTASEIDFVSQYFVHRDDGHVFFTGGALPSMLTPKLEAMQLDCVCYLMKKVRL